jgi:hypothetical protein
MSGPTFVRRASERLRGERRTRRRIRQLAAWVPPRRSPDPSSGGVVVSLTSHRPRFGTLELALRSLLDQDHPADAVVLWVSAGERSRLPGGVEALTAAGLVIGELPVDLGPAGKLLPSLTAFGDSVIVTADDDVVYARTWLGGLLAAHARMPEAIACVRAHYLAFGADGALLPYQQWGPETALTGPDQRLFFTGHGGVLYPPGSLPEVTLDDDLRRSLSPTADDVWLNWMARLAGIPIVRVPGVAPRHDAVPGSQQITLAQANVAAGGNDRQIARMVAAFGSPDPETGELTARQAR